MKLAFILDPIAHLDPGHDTTVALMEAAQHHGHEIWIAEIGDLAVWGGQAWAQLRPLHLTPVTLGDNRWIAPNPWFSLGERQFLPLGNFEAVWMRKDPPVTSAYLYATYILDRVPPSTLVLNTPQGIRAANEKMYALHFPEAIPTTIVTQDKETIRRFMGDRGAVVLKPLGGKAGEGILFLQEGDRNFNSLVEISTKQNQEPIMVQTYLPAAAEGDKRIILLDGEPIGALNRIPTGSDFRGNMAVGGRVAAVDITDRDRQICEIVAPRLRQDGLYFVGLDVIGGYLTEVNVTSPTGVREIDRLCDVRLGETVITWLEKVVAGRSPSLV